MDPSVEVQTISIWVIIGAYVVPSLISIGTFLLQTKKDKVTMDTTIEKTDSDIEHQETQDDIDSGRLSLEWAKEFRNRLDAVEKENKEHCVEIAQLRVENVDLQVRIRKLEIENADLKNQLEYLQGENTKQKARINELEIENSVLRKDLANLVNGRPKEEPC